MTRRQAGRTLLGLAVTGILAASATAQTAEPKARPLLVGVVDLGVVFARSERTAGIARQVAREREPIDARTREQRGAIDSLRRDLEATPDDNPTKRLKVAELMLLEKGLEAIEHETTRLTQQRFETLTLAVIDEIDAAVREFAKTHGYDLILKTTTKGWGETRLPERLYRAQISTVVAYDPALDVTDAIVEQLNANPEGERRTFH